MRTCGGTWSPTRSAETAAAIEPGIESPGSARCEHHAKRDFLPSLMDPLVRLVVQLIIVGFARWRGDENWTELKLRLCAIVTDPFLFRLTGIAVARLRHGEGSAEILSHADRFGHRHCNEPPKGLSTADAFDSGLGYFLLRRGISEDHPSTIDFHLVCIRAESLHVLALELEPLSIPENRYGNRTSTIPPVWMGDSLLRRIGKVAVDEGRRCTLVQADQGGLERVVPHPELVGCFTIESHPYPAGDVARAERRRLAKCGCIWTVYELAFHASIEFWSADRLLDALLAHQISAVRRRRYQSLRRRSRLVWKTVLREHCPYCIAAT